MSVPTIDALQLEHAFRRRAFNILLRQQEIAPALVDAMHSWKHSGFSAHTAVRVLPEEPATCLRAKVGSLCAPGCQNLRPLNPAQEKGVAP